MRHPKLTTFLYFIIRDEVTIGRINEILSDVEFLDQDNSLPIYSSTHIINYVNEILERLLNK